MNETPFGASRLDRFVGKIVLGGNIIMFPVVALVFLYAAIFHESLRISRLERDTPDQQKQFAGLAKKYHDSPTSQYANETCEFLNENLSATDWFGTAKDVWRTSDGRVGLAVWLPAFETPDSYVILLSGEELISPSVLNPQILALLQPGNGLHFSGQFMPPAKDCVQEAAAISGMRERQWLFKFNSVRPNPRLHIDPTR